MSRLSIPVEEYTTPNPVTAREEVLLDELAGVMKANSVRHMPIVRGDKVIGIVSERDLRLAAGLTANEKRQLRAGDIMTTDPVTVSARDTLDAVAFQMSDRKIGSVIVNDEEDHFMGIFTVTDALNALIEIARSGGEEEN